LSAHAGPSLAALAAAIGDARRIDLPVLAEMVPGGFDGPAPTVDQIALSARIGAELGADLIKTPFCHGFEQVVRSTFVPVVILGGSKKGSQREMLGHVHASIQAGGAGVAIGRNVFQAADPEAMTAALVAIVHGGADVDQAAALVSSG
jgi:DhnA family fructose-bisphosphate aldolase class Ia